MGRLPVALLVVVLVAGCGGGARVANQVTSSDGRFALEYKWQAGTVHEGEFQAMDIAVTRAPEDCPKAGITVSVDANMPQHGHGLHYRAVVTTVSPQHYLAKGLMFHMGGAWELYFDLACGNVTTRLVVPLSVS